MIFKSVDLILTDLSYNILQYFTWNIPREGKSTLNNDIADGDKTIIGSVEYVDAFKYIVKPRSNIIIFVWYKTNSTSKVCGKKEEKICRK